mmetsp:Transcript_19629/g.50023  ORF Transcript_19629/g.50023 Transcript_19629/m.50023 type:complete len:402 (+) Transcript_19629:1098-2303(+)
MAGGLPGQVGLHPAHDLALGRLPQRRVLQDLPLDRAPDTRPLWRELRLLRADTQGERGQPAEAVREGAGRHQAPEGVHLVVRHVLQPREAGAVEAEDHRQDGRGGSDREGRARPHVPLHLPKLGEDPAARARLPECLLCLLGQEGGLFVHQPRVWHRLRLAHRARRPQRCWQVHTAQADGTRAEALGGRHPAQPAPAHWALQPALGGRARSREDTARLYARPAPGWHRHGRGQEEDGHHRLAWQAGHLRCDGQQADAADEDDVARLPRARCLLPDVAAQPAHAAARRADQPARHGHDRLARDGDQQILRWRGPCLPRLPAARAGGRRDLGVRQQVDHAVEGRHPVVQGEAAQGSGRSIEEDVLRSWCPVSRRIPGHARPHARRHRWRGEEARWRRDRLARG